MKVDIYWNLHRDCYSVRSAEGETRGRVLGYGDTFTLQDATFTVRDSARLAIVAGGKKTVHAWVRGNLISTSNAYGDAVTYNPRRDPTFVRRTDGAPVYRASLVQFRIVDSMPRVYATK